MQTLILKNRVLVLFAVLVCFTTACKKKKDEDPTPSATSFRSQMSTTSLSATTPYNTTAAITFADSKGDSTVDRTEGRIRLAMFKALDAYGKKGTSQAVDAAVLANMYSNTGNPFSNASLDGSGLNIKEKTATSISAISAETREDIEGMFKALGLASNSFAETAESGKAGIVKNAAGSKYLVDEAGIEWIQVISKSLIGSFQLDYISNTLVANVDADNSQLVAGKKYTALEHNWDEAYGLLTTNDIYAGKAVAANPNATPATTASSGGESFLGSYIWEYNKTDFPKIHEAFVRGRAAIVNNDKTELKKQSDYIRAQMEKSIAMAAVGYLNKFKAAGADHGTAAHAMGEGAGFIYSLRFCKVNGADAAFSDAILDSLLESSANGIWDLDVDKVSAAIIAIQTKFNI